MNTVQPIRDSELVNAIAEDLKENNERDYVMFMTGIYLGLRISDILKLKVKDLKKTHINIRAQKTGKETRILINATLRKAIDDYIKNSNLKDNNYLFVSKTKRYKPITREQAYKILNKIGKKYKLESIGTHTLRKTFGYHFYKQKGDVAMLQTLFGHDNQNDTLRYIGMIQDTIDTNLKNFKI